MSNSRISIGDSTRGYDSAIVTPSKSGKYRLVPNTVIGRVGVIRKSIAAINRGDDSYISASGDCLEIRLTTLPATGK